MGYFGTTYCPNKCKAMGTEPRDEATQLLYVEVEESGTTRLGCWVCQNTWTLEPKELTHDTP